MKLGISMNFSHSSPEEWAEKHKNAGLSSVVFPCSYEDGTARIDAYAHACAVYDLTVAEVGAWKNLLSLDKAERQKNFDYCLHQLELADYVGAHCCVNISGAKGDIWDGAYPENYSEETYARIIETVQKLIDGANPKRTFYTLEPMPWMHPDSPEDYLQMIHDIDRPAFGVHMDMVNMINTPKKYLFSEEFTDKAFSLLGAYIKSCHVKDVLLAPHLTVQMREVPCGEGGFSLKHYIDRINLLDENMPVIIEHLSIEEEYRKAIRYIRSITEENHNE